MPIAILGDRFFNQFEEVFILGVGQDKHYRTPAFWLMLVVLFAVLCEHTKVAAKSAPPQPRFIGAAHALGEMPTAALAVNSVCNKI